MGLNTYSGLHSDILQIPSCEVGSFESSVAIKHNFISRSIRNINALAVLKKTKKHCQPDKSGWDFTIVDLNVIFKNNFTIHFCLVVIEVNSQLI